MTRPEGAECVRDGRREVRLSTEHRHYTVAPERGTQMDYDLAGAMLCADETVVAPFAKALW